MRTVAVVLALFAAALIVPPSTADDECSTNAAEGRACVTIPVEPSPQPPLVPSVYWGKYYVYAGPTACTSPFSNECRGTPSSPGSGVPLPAGGSIGVGAFGIVWEESNGLSGLQRHPVYSGGYRLADKMVLV